MKMLYFCGQNCYLSSLLNVVSTVFDNYKEAFATLWTESQFDDIEQHGIFVSRRIYQNLTAIGAEILEFECNSQQKAAQIFFEIEGGEFFVLGMDRFFVPWDPLFGAAHEQHYFFAEKQQNGRLVGFDSIYGHGGVALNFEEMCKHCFCVHRVKKTAAIAKKFDLKAVASDALCLLGEVKSQLVSDIENCTPSNAENMKLHKQIAALQNNRRLFAIFLHQTHGQFFDEKYFSLWSQLKNGVLRQAVFPSQKLLNQLLQLVDEIFCHELQAAEFLLA